MRRALDTELVAHHVYLFGAVASARAAVQRLAEHGAREGTVVLADEPETARLHVSLLLRPACAPRAVGAFATRGALALAEAVEADGVVATLRRGHDVMVDGRRLGAALAECDSADDRVTHVLLHLDIDLDVLGAEVDRNLFVSRLLTRLEHWYRDFSRYEAIHEVWT
jgi:BirA family transcriptional regulator, biotin operon repressor / biotin---[acetyl-CoA-carboxylase] ligase